MVGFEPTTYGLRSWRRSFPPVSWGLPVFAFPPKERLLCRLTYPDVSCCTQHELPYSHKGGGRQGTTGDQGRRVGVSFSCSSFPSLCCSARSTAGYTPDVGSLGSVKVNSSGVIPNASASRLILLNPTVISPRSARTTVARDNPDAAIRSDCVMNLCIRHNFRNGKGRPRTCSATELIAFLSF